MKISFPVIDEKKQEYPEKVTCPICKKNEVGEPHSFAVLNGGAKEKKGKLGYGTEIRSKNIVGFLSLYWHGAHDDGKGDFRETFHLLDIVEKAAGGNFGLYFCSTSCLRTFLNTAVDELEREIRKPC